MGNCRADRAGAGGARNGVQKCGAAAGVSRAHGRLPIDDAETDAPQPSGGTADPGSGFRRTAAGKWERRQKTEPRAICPAAQIGDAPALLSFSAVPSWCGL